MRVRFSATALADPGSQRHLDRMVEMFEDGRHEWMADNPDEIEASQWSQDPGRAGIAARKALREHIRLAAYPKDCITITVELRTRSETRLGPQDAVMALQEPVRVAVENAMADGGFLLTAIHALDREGLWHAHEQRWLTFEHMGGYGEVERTLIRLRHGVQGPFRVFVLADGDARYPGERTQTMEKVAEACRAAQVPYAILRKRKIENYLPISVLDRRVERRYRPTFLAFLRLTDDQRSHYEMKTGLDPNRSGKAQVEPAQADLFARTPPSVLKGLRLGFGKRIASCFASDRDMITKRDIRQVCQGDEAEIGRMLDQIERLL